MVFILSAFSFGYRKQFRFLHLYIMTSFRYGLFALLILLS